MPIASTENLFKLVKSLSKSEKRAFKLYARRNQGEGDLMFLKLFDTLDKQKVLNDESLKSKLKGITTAAYSNLKRHLYEQIMISLRLLYKDKKQNIKIREYIDFAHVLYGKGLHMQALQVLEKARSISSKHHNDFSLLTIIELEKMIQSRHITRTKTGRILELMEDAEVLSEKINRRIKLSNIRIRLHKFYIEQGHVTDVEEEKKLTSFFTNSMHEIDESSLNGMELIYYFQSYVWYNYILDDFANCFRYALKWVDLFKNSRELQNRDIDLFMRGYHYVLTAAFHLKDRLTYQNYLEELELLRQEKYSKLNLNSQIVSFQYVHNGRMNLHFLEGTFEKGMINIPSTLSRIHRYKNKLDAHKVMVIYYKVSWMYIGNGEPEKALKYLNRIIGLTEKSLRVDIQCFTRLMLLIALLELDEYEQFDTSYASFKRFFKKQEVPNKVQHLILEMLYKLMSVGVYDRKSIYIHYYDTFNQLVENRFERRSFIYLDILPWIYSKINRLPLGESIQHLNDNGK